MRKFLTLAAAFAVAAITAIPVQAQTFLGGYKLAGPATGAATVDDTTVAFYVKYVGTTAGKPTVEVDSSTTRDITFKIAGSVDTSVGCPTAGTGIIDVSNAACDTFGEVINKVIGQSTNWVLIPGALLATESSNQTLKALSATDTNIRTTGVAMYFDNQNVNVSADLVSVVIGPPTGANASFWTSGNKPNPNPFSDLFTFLSFFSEKKTSGGTIGNTIVYAVKSVFSGILGSTASYTETSRVAWSETGGATTVENQTDFTNFPLIAAPGEHFILRISSSTSISAQAVVGAGAFVKQQP